VSATLEEIGARLAAGERLSDAHAGVLETTSDLIGLGMLADEARQRRHGRQTTFVRVAEVRIDVGTPVAVPAAAQEVRVLGTPTSVQGAVSCVRQIAAAAGGRPVSGFALDDLKTLARAARISLEALARHLSEAGLEFVAEVPIDLLENPAAAVEAMVRGGLGAPRVSVARQDPSARLDILRRTADLQRATGAARVFAPLSRDFDPVDPSTGYDDVKQVALARLLVENIPSIQVDWARYGPKLAQVALTFGADDIDGVSPVDSLELGARRAPLEEVLRNIRAASFEPVQRDGRFGVVSA
jgi:aminodeoxyfutalosine synthase